MKLTILHICTLFLILFCFNAQAIVKNINYRLSANNQAEVRDSRFVQARIWSLRPKINANFKISNDLLFRTELEGYFETGSNDSLYIDEYRPRREIFLNDGYFSWGLSKDIQLDFGAMNQQSFNSPLFLTATAFTGARESFNFFIGAFNITLSAQQMIANNQNLSARLNSVDEGTPKFFSETVQAKFASSQVELNIGYSLYRFDNLSRAVAHESRFLGNSVSGTGQDNASFLYQYQGHNTYAKIHLKNKHVQMHLSGHYTHNNKTSNNRADAILLKVGIGLRRFLIFMEDFRSESDVVPAYYNSKFYGHNNYKGQIYGFLFKTEKSKLDISFRYTRASRIQASLFQDDFTGTQLSFGKEI